MHSNLLKLSNTLAKFLWAALLTSTLLLSACGGKDKSAGLPKGQKVLSASVLKFDTIPKRTVSEDEAERALAAFGVDEINSVDGVKRSGEGGNYVYTKQNAKDADFTIGSFEVIGLHMLGDIPMFDGIIFRDVSSIDEDSGVKSSFKEVAFMGPTPMLCQMIADGIKAGEVRNEDEEIAAYFKAVLADIDKLDLNAEDRKARLVIGFDSVSMSGISIDGDGTDISVESMILGKTKDGTGAAQIKNVHIDIVDDPGDTQGFLKLGLYETTGFNLEIFSMFANPDFYARAEAGDNDEELIEILKAYANPYNPHYDGYLIKNFSFSMDGDFSMDMDQASLISTRKGGVITRKTRVSPITFSWPEQVADPDLQKAFDNYARMGYDKVVLSGGVTTVLNEADDTVHVSEYYVQFDDMFKVSGDLKMEGVKTAFTKFIDVMGAEGFEEKSDDEASAEMMRIFASELGGLDWTLTFTDLSIIERSLKIGAEELTKEGLGDMTPEMMKGKAKAGVTMLPMAAQDDAQLEYLTDLSEALSSLIDNGGSITFRMNPKMPLDFKAIEEGVESGEFDISVLGLEVSAQGAEH